MRKSTFLWLLLAVICGCMLFRTSQEVTDGRTKLAAIEASTRKEDESIRVLEAEWSYLNQPDRLEKLSKQYLTLAPLKGKQFSKISGLEDKTAGDKPAADVTADKTANDKAETANPVLATVDAAEDETDTTVDASDDANAEVKAPEAVATAPVKAEPAKPAAEKTVAEKTADKSSAAAAFVSSLKIDKASTAESTSTLAKTKAAAAKPAATATAAHTAAKTPAHGYVYSPPVKPYAKTAVGKTGAALPYGGTKYATTYAATSPAPQPVHDSQRGFGDVLKSLGGN